MGTIDQNVVPGLISLGLRLVRVIPGIGSLAGWIRVNDEPSVPVVEVIYDLPRAENRKFFFGNKALVQVDHEKKSKKGPLE